MKKSILIVSVIAFMTLMAGCCCFADVTGVTDTSKEGSLLIWPLIQTNDGNETYIVITNSEAGGNETRQEFDSLVSIKCYWEVRTVPYEESYGDLCKTRDAMFMLSINNTYMFRASDGMSLDGEDGRVTGIGYEKKGMLKCWAATPDDANQISWNHLSGYAIIVKPTAPPGPSPLPLDSAWKYSAWRFAANVVEDVNGTTFVDGPWLGRTQGANFKSSRIDLKGANKVVDASGTCPTGTVKIRFNDADYLCVQRADPAECNCDEPELACFTQSECSKPGGAYDACPQYLLFNFLAEPSPGDENFGHARNYLALAPCKEDLRGEEDEDDPEAGAVDWYTRLVYSVWNSNEEKLTGTTSCAHCNGPPGGTYDIYLSELKVGGMSCFDESILKTNSGRVKIRGMAAGARSECANAKATPLVGVMARRMIKPYDSVDLFGTGGTSAGAEFKNPGWIKWDGGEPVIPEKPKR